MRYLICGSRTFDRRDTIEAWFWANDVAGIQDVIIHGAARGADSLAADVARERGCTVLAFPADWNRHGKAAGFIRNQQMLDEGKPDHVIAFVDKPLAESRGTADMVHRAVAAGLHGSVFQPAR